MLETRICLLRNYIGKDLSYASISRNKLRLANCFIIAKNTIFSRSSDENESLVDILGTFEALMHFRNKHLIAHENLGKELP